MKRTSIGKPQEGCTYHKSGSSSIKQNHWQCKTCEERSFVCETCIKTCHIGHIVIYHGENPGFCVCGHCGCVKEDIIEPGTQVPSTDSSPPLVQPLGDDDDVYTKNIQAMYPDIQVSLNPNTGQIILSGNPQDVELSEHLRTVLERFSQSCERELKQRTNLEDLKRLYPGFHGRLIDLCRPTNRRYDQALSTVLGRHMDAIVVDTEKTAIDCIQYLREQRSSPITFLPLDSLRYTPPDDRIVRTMVQGARPAIDIVDYEPVFARALKFACGSAIVCDSIDVAICYWKQFRVKAITLDGTIIHKSGMITANITNK